MTSITVSLFLHSVSRLDWQAGPRTGEGQAALLSGEAGIGQSRLAAALLERLTGAAHALTLFLLAAAHYSALYPIIGQMERAARLVHGDKNCCGMTRRLPCGIEF